MFINLTSARTGLIAFGLAAAVIASTADAGTNKPSNTLSQNTHPSQKPDLVVHPKFKGNGPMPNSGYCGSVGQTRYVMFRVANGGPKPSPATTVLVDFAAGADTSLNVPAMAAHSNGQFYQVPLPMVGSQNISFTIKVDPQNDVPEKSYTNNIASSVCSLPHDGS